MFDDSKYFKRDKVKNKIYFIGTKLEIFVSVRFENYKCLQMDTSLTTLALFDIIIDDKIEDAFFLPAIVNMEPSDMKVVTFGDDKFVKATFIYGDCFINNTVVSKTQDLGYVIFYELINSGNRSKHLTYDKIAKIFDMLGSVCDVKAATNRKTAELLMSWIYRSKKNLSIFYRQTDMKEPPVALMFKDTPHAAISTTGKLIGNYWDDSVRSAIVNPATDTSDVEEILRA